MKLYLKDMVSSPRKQAKLELKSPFALIESEMVKQTRDLHKKKQRKIKSKVLPLGLKLHSSNKISLVEKVKDVIKEMLGYTDGFQVVSYSAYISKKLHHDYTYLANIFSEVNGISIQQYIIHSKIERVKFYFLTSDISLTEISYLLHYSSVAHLSSQFKKITGFCPSSYKQIHNKKVNLLEID